MKFLEVLQSLIVPNHMYKRRKMNMLISVLIMIAGLYLLALPISHHFSNNRYEVIEQTFDFDVFHYVDDEDLAIEPITDEEKAKYNMVTLDDIKALKANISVYGFVNDELIETGKEYVLKSVMPVLDEEGSIVDYSIYYVHLVFENGEENKYDIAEKFDKLPKENGVFNHFLLVFYKDGFTYRSNYEISNKMNPSNILYDSKISVNLPSIEKGIDISYPLIDMMVPMYKYQYQLRSALYVVLFPTIMALLFSFVLKNTGLLRGFKEYYNLAAVSSIPMILGCIIISFISVPVCNFVFQYFTFINVIYYFIVVVITNRKPQME